MRRALLAGALLGAVAGLVLIHRDALRLTTAWPVILGFALWDSVGHRGSRGVLAAAAAAVGAIVGYASFGIVAEVLPITDLWLGIVSGVAVGLMVVVGVAARERFPLSGMLIGFAAFFGVFEPLWRQSAANVRTHGVENLSITLLALLVGVLSAAAVRGITDSSREITAAVRRRPAREDEPTVPLSDVLEGGAE